MAIVSDVIQRGTRASQPAANTVGPGVLYFVTDEFTLEQSNGSSWVKYEEPPTVFNAGNSSTAITIDWHNGRKQRVTMTGNCTVTLSNPTDGARYVLYFDTGAGGFTLSITGVQWPGGTAPTLTATASKTDIIVLVYRSDTSHYYGNFSQNFTT